MYPLTRQQDYSELRYSLRSLERHLKPPFEVVTVGDYLPDWANNITNIELGDIPGRPQLSVRRKILAALGYSDEILYMNDDIYFLQKTEIPYYWYGDLKANGMSGAKPLRDELAAMGKPTKSFELHYPIILKKDFKEIIQHFSEDCLNRSAYCNYLGIEGAEMPDCKILSSLKLDKVRIFIKGKPFLSTGVRSVQSVLPILQELFTTPSRFEI